MEPPDAPSPSEVRPNRRPVWIAAAVVAVLVVVLLAYALTSNPTLPPQQGQAVPPFELTTLDGKPADLESLAGQVVVLNFFSSWCAPCRQEAPDLQQAWQRYQDRDVQFLGVAFKDASSKAQAFLDEFDATYPAAMDAGSRTARAYGVTGVPETFVIDRQGRLVRHFVGPVTADELSQEIEALLGP